MGGYINRDKLISSLTREDITHIITELGSPHKIDSQGNLCCSTVLCHGGDSPTKLVYYFNHEKDETERDRLHCFTCGDTYDIVELVIRAHRNKGMSITYYKALKWIAHTTGKSIDNDFEKPKDDLTDMSWLNRIKRAINHKYESDETKEINENILDIFTQYPWEPWTKEHISYTAMSVFEIGYYGLNDSITIPHRDAQGRLIGVRQRYLDEWDIEHIGKYTPVQIEGRFLSHKLGNEFYGLWICAEQIKKTKRAIVVEAEKSVLQGYSYYGYESTIIATCGSNISTTQTRILLRDLGVEEVIYAPDRDYHDAHSFEAEAWLNNQRKKLEDLIPYCDVYLIADSQDRLNYKQSPTDCGKEIFEQLLSEKISITK